MIYEYALEPEMVATWGNRHNYRFFIREFGLERGRLVSHYPKTWMRRVWDMFAGGSEMDRKRLEELLARLKDVMVKRNECHWDDSKGGWVENALEEHIRYPFRAILARNNPQNLPQIICEDDLATSPCQNWDNPHGIVVNRKAPEMAAAIEMMLSRCQWVKFIDPHISPGRSYYRVSLRAFLDILARERPVGPPEGIEIHTEQHHATEDFLRKSYEQIIPAGLSVSIFHWQERPGGQELHNRYVLTDLGGVSFHHGLDAGKDGETDDITRLDREQYLGRCKQYDPAAPAFDQAAPPLVIIGILGE
jgi:hypothetical protein